MKREERFWSHVDKSDGCWLWRGSDNGNGYGTFSKMYAHRYSYELHVGPIPQGLEIDHLCRVRNCVNPAHLEAVTHQENMRRGDTGPGRNARKTHCNNGHPYDEANTYHWRGKKRICRACHRAHEAARKARLAAESAA